MTRLGVAGLGWLGESLIKDVPRVWGFEVSAVQDIRVDLAREVASRYHVRPSLGGYEELLARDDVDAVAICTPNAFHATQAQAALRAGKDVLVQKPLAICCADAEATLRVAGETGRLLFVDYTYRFIDTLRLLEARLATAGAVRSVRAAFHNIYGPGSEKTWFFDPRLSGGGALTDLGVHLLDLALWLLRPSRVELRSAELSDTRPVEHAAALRLDLDDVPFELAVSWNAPLAATDISFEVATERGRLRWENVDGSFFRFRFRCLPEDAVLLDRETSLREDTLRAFADALARRALPPVDTRVYALLDQAYGR